MTQTMPLEFLGSTVEYNLSQTDDGSAYYHSVSEGLIAGLGSCQRSGSKTTCISMSMLSTKT